MAQSNHERVDRRWNKKSSRGNLWTSWKASKFLDNWLRALFQAIVALEGMKETTQKAAPDPANAGKSWEQAEDEQLKEALDQGMSIKELANRHQRTVGAIEARLVRLGKVPSREYARAMFSGKSQ